ncbi:MAG TPA: hypothetical protein VGK38_13160, partial [Prolixibacteraceae bacterium]
MFKQLLLFVLFSFSAFTASSQIAVTGIPESFSLATKSAVVIPYKVLNPIDTTQLINEDKNTGVPNRCGVVQQINIDIKAEGVRTEIIGKGYIWRYQLKSLQAYSLGISFGKFLLPEGSSLFIYDENHSQLSGAFTSLNNNSMNQLTIADFIGQNAIIEYFEPYNPTFPGQLTISSVSQTYKNFLKAAVIRVGINCPEGAGWQDAKHSV